MADNFESHTISLILSWVLSVVLIVSVISGAIAFVSERTMPRLFAIWLLLCVAVLSPLRYILLQVSVGMAYPVQSISAMLSSIPLAFYIPIVFGIMCAIGLLLPLVGIVGIAGYKRMSTGRLFGAAVAAPVLLLLGTYLYFLVLPYAAYSTHWLKATDVIRATNGPPEYLYKYIAEEVTPLQFPLFVRDVGEENLTSTERLRAHVAVIYLGNKEFSSYMYNAYPKLRPK